MKLELELVLLRAGGSGSGSSSPPAFRPHAPYYSSPFKPHPSPHPIMRAHLSRLALHVAAVSLVATLGSTAALAQATPSDSAIRDFLRLRVDSGTSVGIVVGVLE